MEDNLIISKYIDRLAQANHDKILLEAKIDLLEKEIKELNSKDTEDYEQIDGQKLDSKEEDNE